MKVTGIILAGGKNLRMGKNKAFLEIGGRRIIERTQKIFAALFDEIILVTNTPLDYLSLNLRAVADLFPGKGALGGIYTGLFHASHSHAFVAACDMPFLNPPLIAHLLDLAPGYDIVIPRTQDGFQPLHAVYSQKCLPFIEALLRKEDLKIIDFFPRVKKRDLLPEELFPFDPELLSFVNINTPEDLARAEDWVRQGKVETQPLATKSP